MEIVVDAYGPEEQAMGRYYYLENQLQFPLTATCIKKRAVSPLHVNDEVEVIGMPAEEECEKEMFVTIRWGCPNSSQSAPLTNRPGNRLRTGTIG